MQVLVAVRREFWLLIREGCSAGEAAVRVGMSEQTGQRWFRDAGGMSPVRVVVPVPAAPQGRRLTMDERELIARGVTLQMTLRAIGRMIGRSHTTVKRELDRNRNRKRPVRYRSRGQLKGPRIGRARSDTARTRPGAGRNGRLGARRPRSSPRTTGCVSRCRPG